MCKWVVLGVLLASASVAFADEPAVPVPPPSDTPADPPAPAESTAPAATPAPDPSAPAVAPSATASGAPVVAPPSSYTPLPYAEPLRPAPPPVRDPQPVPGDKPPLSGSRLVGEAAIGSLFAIGGTIGGAYIGFSLETANGCNGEFCGFGGLVLGGLAGLTFVTPLGVYLVGNSAGETGSLGATIGGSVLGLLAGGGTAAILQSEDAAPVLILAGPVIGSVIGFNLTRRFVEKRAPRAWAPVANVSNGTASFGIVGRF